MTRSALALTAIAAAVLALGGCAVGPRYESPLPAAPAQNAFAGAADAARFTADSPPADWWTLYDEPALTAAIDDALAANTDVRVASANLSRAAAFARSARGERLPATTLSTGAARVREPVAQQAPPVVFEDTTYSFGLDVSYQADFFGRARRAVAAADADFGAAQAALDVTRLTVAAETARAYADACAAAYQAGVARRSAELQRESHALTERMLEAGRGTAFDVARAAAQLEQTRAAIPSLEAQRNAALYRLAVLRGLPPTAATPGAADCAAPLRVAGALPVGDGAALLRRRPDLRVAERRLAAATARVGIATADLYPHVTIGASAGATALAFDDLDASDARRYSIGPLLSFTFPNRVAARARLAAAAADAEAALAEFDGAWLTALRETETTLTQYAGELERRAALAEARRHGADAAMLADARFQAGQSSFLDVLQAQLALASAEMALAESEARLADLEIALILALGGGFAP